MKDSLVSPPNVRDFAWLAVSCVLIGLISWFGIKNKSITVDETVHVVAGDAAWTLSDYRINPENGNLPGRVAALPIQFLENKPLIDTDSIPWVSSSQWEVALNWWFNSGADPKLVLGLSRISMLTFNLFGIALIFGISGSLWGRGGAWLSLILAGFSPNFLGHIPLATSDFSGAWTLVLAVLCYVRLLEYPMFHRALMAGLTAGMALLCKHSAVIAAPVAMLILIWRLLEHRPLPVNVNSQEKFTTRFVPKFFVLLSFSIVAAGISLLTIWTAYSLRLGAASPAAGEFNQFQIPREVIQESSNSTLISLLREWRILPEAYLYGLDFIVSHSVRGGFLNGDYNADGHRFYHLWTFLYKTPIPALILHLAGMGFLLVHLGKKRLKISPILRGLFVLGLAYGLLLMNTKLAIGHRHAFILLYISTITAGILIKSLVEAKPWILYATIVLAISTMPFALANSNRFIAYVNPIGGGERLGYRHLADSSLDWGQDLPAAIKRLDRHRLEYPQQTAYLAYFGTADLLAYGMDDSVAFLAGLGNWQRRAYVPSLEPGMYVISATLMVPTKSKWTLNIESAFLALKNRVTPVYQKLLLANDTRVAFANATLTAEEIWILNEFESLRFQRLKMALLSREPDEILNGSILVYEVNSEELDIFQ